MKKFEYPEIDVIAIAVEDVIATSSTGGADVENDRPPVDDL